MQETADQLTPQSKTAREHPAWVWLGFAVTLAFVVTAAVYNRAQLFTVSSYDSYALQAKAWREGLMHLPGNLAHLELAIFDGEYYVSFPPVPTIPIWLLQWIMPGGVPSGLLTVVYLLLCYPLSYLIGRRYIGARGSAILAATAIVGGSFLDVAVSGSAFSGGVWYQAQALGLLLTLCAFHSVPHPRKAWRFAGWLAIALAVGCRPFQGIYIPVLVWMQRSEYLAANHDGDADGSGAEYVDPARRLRWFARDVLPYWIAPMFVATAMGWYNWARFGSPLEFGHNYLPEFTRPGQTQFALSHIAVNIFRILRPPFGAYSTEMADVAFPLWMGFAVYLTQPLLTDASASLLRRNPDTGDWIFLCALIVHFLLLLSHRTFGGWQYGTRYVCDMLPGLLAVRLRNRRDPGLWECAFLLILAAGNLAGTIAFHALSGM
ncbi:MAG: hypothetical protein LBK46_03165 [Oscillospiraceae bacterium]|jgi:hypothetical protein|nr:hypothetical protein [Oscillospiraceae bacterium]